MSEGELYGLLGEIGGACTYDNMVRMFQEKMAGDGNDSDDLIVQAFKAYDQEGKIDSKMFQNAASRNCLMFQNAASRNCLNVYQTSSILC